LSISPAACVLTLREVLGRKAYPSIADIPERIDIVDVFRKSEDVPAVVDDLLQKKDGIKSRVSKCYF
jgi:predicted CoA-binding protein